MAGNNSESSVIAVTVYLYQDFLVGIQIENTKFAPHK